MGIFWQYSFLESVLRKLPRTCIYVQRNLMCWRPNDNSANLPVLYSSICDNFIRDCGGLVKL
jgi:hypothetical protein